MGFSKEQISRAALPGRGGPGPPRAGFGARGGPGRGSGGAPGGPGPAKVKSCGLPPRMYNSGLFQFYHFLILYFVMINLQKQAVAG